MTNETELLAKIAVLEYRNRFLEARVPQILSVENLTGQPVDRPVSLLGFAASTHKITLTDDMVRLGAERHADLELDRMATQDLPGVSELDPSFLARCGLVA